MVTDYFGAFKQVYEELNASLLIISVVRKMQKQRGQLPVLTFLEELYIEYDAVCSQISGGTDRPSLAETFSRVPRVSRESAQELT